MLHATIIKLLLLLVTLILTFKKQFLKSQKHPKTFSLFLHISDWPGRYTWARRASRGRTWVAANNRTEPEARTRAPRRHAQRNRPPTVTKHLTYYTHKRRQSRWKNEPGVKRENVGYIICKIHVWKWPVVKDKHTKMKPRIYVPFVFDLDGECKFNKNNTL